MRRLFIPLLALQALLISGIALAAPSIAQAAGLCCACTIGGDKICLTDPPDTCGDLVDMVKNPNLKGAVCDPHAVASSACKTGEGGVCSGVFAASSYKPLESIDDFTESSSTIFAPKLNVPIPGLTFTSFINLKGVYYNVPYLAQYIAGIYRYLLSISLITAAVMIIYGGFLYVMGSTLGQITSGKEKIKDAIIGLVLIFGCVTLVETINPNLTLNTLQVQQITPLETALETVGVDPNTGEPFVEHSDGSPPNVVARACPITKLKLYKQYGAPWGSMAAGPLPLCTPEDKKANPKVTNQANAICCASNQSSSCGATALASVLASYGVTSDSVASTLGRAGVAFATGDATHPLNPEDVVQLYSVSKTRVCNTGGFFPDAGVAKQVFADFDFKNISRNAASLDPILQEGRPVIFLCMHCAVFKKGAQTAIKDPQKQCACSAKGDPCPRDKCQIYPGHFMVLVGKYDTGDYAVWDVGGGYDLIKPEDLFSSFVTQFYYIAPKDKRPVAGC